MGGARFVTDRQLTLRARITTPGDNGVCPPSEGAAEREARIAGTNSREVLSRGWSSLGRGPPLEGAAGATTGDLNAARKCWAERKPGVVAYGGSCYSMRHLLRRPSLDDTDRSGGGTNSHQVETGRRKQPAEFILGSFPPGVHEKHGQIHSSG